MQQLIIDFKNKLEKSEILTTEAFDDYIYSYTLDSICKLAAMLENNKLLARTIEIDYSLKITKFFEDTNTNFLSYKSFKVNFNIDKAQDIIRIIDTLEEIYGKIFNVFPIYCKDMRRRHGKEVDSFLSHLAFECALTHNRLKLISSDLKVISKYKQTIVQATKK